jgi:hypothetical protein
MLSKEMLFAGVTHLIERLSLEISVTILIQFNSIYLCGKLNSPEANYKVSTGKKMGRVRSKNVSENNNIVIKVIK